MRRFVMIRHRDLSGVSGSGVVIWGICWPDGRVSYRWNTATATTCEADSITDVQAIHGHDGATELRWLDTLEAADTWTLVATDAGTRGGEEDPGGVGPELKTVVAVHSTATSPSVSSCTNRAGTAPSVAGGTGGVG